MKSAALREHFLFYWKNQGNTADVVHGRIVEVACFSFKSKLSVIDLELFGRLTWSHWMRRVFID